VLVLFTPSHFDESVPDYRRVRRDMVTCVLATDMALHVELTSALIKVRVSTIKLSGLIMRLLLM
jgi:hypothetical protein